ncbi:Lysine-specific permease [Zancudomyces culisetae]|uniref:Lysine-specific permease n=1 Tax=Zancudomyces culisetae TaxID=1213189 RepID=A0A1R1PU11_ZANCU|nr:Lysine-specific permease [Zancudomyces culisetae]|eukprot:OMH84382.1 Lysine-specific permease [Zancudomyces culisetae]
MSSDMIEDTNKTHIGEKTTDSIEVRDENNKLKRDLKRRHMAMVAVGGTMGTGLFMGSGITISEGGPGGALLGYAITGVVSFFILTSLAEMSAFIPISGSFNAFADRFVDPAYGFAMSWFYFYNWVITVAADLVAFGGHTYGVENWSYGSGAFKDGMLGIINVCVYAGIPQEMCQEPSAPAFGKSFFFTLLAYLFLDCCSEIAIYSCVSSCKADTSSAYNEHRCLDFCAISM